MLDPAARRLIVASVVRLHVATVLGRDPVGPQDAPERARLLGDADQARLSGQGLSFDPAFPGVTAGPEPVAGGTRVVLMCRARYAGALAAVVITALVPGRVPEVTAAPPETPIPG